MPQDPEPSTKDWLRDFIADAVHEDRVAAPAAHSDDADFGGTALVEGVPEQGDIGHYRITEKLGVGGMGVVLKAFDSHLNRFVAIKFLKPRLALATVAKVRFMREAQAAAAVNHPNVVIIHAIGEHAGLPYLVMEHVAGVTLAERLTRQGVLETKEVLRIGAQVAAGLDAAHRQGMVHRDIKPANILLEGGMERVKITDFGLARVADALRLTESGALAGTPRYMSPEQASGAALDHRSDLFSLGSVLYELCAGVPAFPGRSVHATLETVRAAAPRPLRALNPDVPPWLAAIIHRLLARDPAARFGSAAEVADLLTNHLMELQRTGRPASVPDPSPEAGRGDDLGPPRPAPARGEFRPGPAASQKTLPYEYKGTPDPKPWTPGPGGLYILAVAAVLLLVLILPPMAGWLADTMAARVAHHYQNQLDTPKPPSPPRVVYVDAPDDPLHSYQNPLADRYGGRLPVRPGIPGGMYGSPILPVGGMPTVDPFDPLGQFGSSPYDPFRARRHPGINPWPAGHPLGRPVVVRDQFGVPRVVRIWP